MANSMRKKGFYLEQVGFSGKQRAPVPRQRGSSFWETSTNRKPSVNCLGDYSVSAGAGSQVLTTYFSALSPREAIAASLVTSVPSSKTTVTTWVSASSPSSTVMDLKPSRLLNAELTSLLQPPQTTPVIPATNDTSPAIAVEARAMTANVMDTISFFIFLVAGQNAPLLAYYTFQTMVP